MIAIPSYVPVPQGATPIQPQITPAGHPRKVERDVGIGPNSSSPLTASFPPNAFASTSTAPSSRLFTIPAIPTSSLSTNVSDLLLSSLLPTNLPKLPSVKPQGGPGRPRELNTQKEGLRLEVMSHNFRRFITKVGPLFWMQDRIEEVLFWRKPLWTWAWMMAWTFISFQPRILLLLPSLILILILLHLSEVRNPLPSLLGSSTSSPSSSTVRSTGTAVDPEGGPVSLTTGVDGEPIPIAPPRETESGVDYYMNLQALQNTMGWVSDGYEDIYAIITAVFVPSKSSTSLPITPTTFLLLLLPPTLLLPLIPPYLIPYLLLPIGWAPPLAFHPNLVPLISSLPSLPIIRQAQAVLTRLMLNDSLPDNIGRATIGEVEVWENERLDPVAVTAKGILGNTLAPGNWSQRFLRPGERLPWVKIRDEGSIWSEEGAVGSDGLIRGGSGKEGKERDLLEGWTWIPGEEWRVDVTGLWSEAGVDPADSADGWQYSDDSWQNPAYSMHLDTESVEVMKRITRRRKWWRRVYRPQEE